jgi:hypothetical protein
MKVLVLLCGSERDALKEALSAWRQVMYMRGWLDPLGTTYDDAIHRHSKYLWNPSL